MTEFYVGYQPKAPAGIHRRIIAVVLLLLILALVAGFVFAKSQRGFAASSFEYGSPRSFEGIVQLTPIQRCWLEGRVASRAAMNRRATCSWQPENTAQITSLRITMAQTCGFPGS